MIVSFFTILYPLRLVNDRLTPSEKESVLSNLSALQAVDFQNKVLNAETPVLVEFGATWCGPCKMLEPVLTSLADDYDGQVDFYSVDVDQNSELVMTYGVMGVPTLILFRGGEPVHRLTGYRPKKALEKAFFRDL